MRFTLVALLFFVSACAINNKMVAVPNGEYAIAILPIANETTNLDGPVQVRRQLYLRLNKRLGEAVMPLDYTDEALRSIGITDGGQLNAVSVNELGEKLHAGRLVYSNLKTYNPLRIMAVAVIDMDVSIYDSKSGSLLWKDRFAVTSKAGHDDADALGHSFSTGDFKYLLGIAFFEKIFRSPLQEETEVLTEGISRQIYRRW